MKIKTAGFLLTLLSAVAGAVGLGACVVNCGMDYFVNLGIDPVVADCIFHFLLTGVKKQEYTNATSTNLVHAQDKTWDLDLIHRLGLPDRLFGALSMPGTVVGLLREEMARLMGYQTTVVLPATHDTGFAFLTVPARDDQAVYLSSGTWSLLGVENDQPITSEASFLAPYHSSSQGLLCPEQLAGSPDGGRVHAVRLPQPHPPLCRGSQRFTAAHR